MTDDELGARLGDLRDDFDLPEVDLVGAVRSEIEGGDRRASRHPHRWLAAAAVVAVLVVAAMVIEPSREALAGWLGIGSTRIERVPDADLPADASLPDLGDTVPLEPDDSPLAALGTPDVVFVDEAGVRSYAWAATDGLPALGESDLGAVLSVVETPADELNTKLVGADDPVEAVTVSGASGLWIPAGHVLLGHDGTPTAAQRVLLWVADGYEYRLETNLDRADALSLAEQVEGTAGG